MEDNEVRKQNYSLAAVDLGQQFSLTLFVSLPPFVLLPYFSRHTWMRTLKEDMRQRNKPQDLSCPCQIIGTRIKTERKREICLSIIIINLPHVWLEQLLYISFTVKEIFIWFVPPSASIPGQRGMMAHCTVTMCSVNKVMGSPGKEMWGLERLASLEEKLTGLAIQQPNTKQF